jgi:hypothetical protein
MKAHLCMIKDLASQLKLQPNPLVTNAMLQLRKVLLKGYFIYELGKELRSLYCVECAS